MGLDSRNRAPCAEMHVGKDSKSGGEALRTAILRDGPEALSDDELLAILLGLADVRSAAEVRRRLGDLTAMLRAPVGALLKMPGLGPVRTSRLIAAVAMVERSAQAGLKALPELSSSSSVRRFLRLKLAHQPREVSPD